MLLFQCEMIKIGYAMLLVCKFLYRVCLLTTLCVSVLKLFNPQGISCSPIVQFCALYIFDTLKTYNHD